MMKFLIKAILVIAVIKTIIVSLLLIGAIVLWLGGADNILLPGLGLVISVPFVLILLLMAEIFLVVIAVLLWRNIAGTRLR